jgi:hypothetical protein
MRRLFSICVLVTALLIPERADAYFWDWIDDLSGPSFHGVTFEFRVWCSLEDARLNRRFLNRLAKNARDQAYRYEGAAVVNRPFIADPALNKLRLAYRQAARAAANESELAVMAALETIVENEGLSASERKDAGGLVLEALARRALADEQFELGERVARGQVVNQPPTTPPSQLDSIRNNKDKTSNQTLAAGFGGGVTMSTCKAAPYARQSRYLSVNIGTGWDTKKLLNATRAPENKMVTVGGSYHSVVQPWLTIGAGAGAAWFSSDVTNTTRTLYVQPYILDFYPAALRKDSQLKGPWWHLFYFRYSTVIFPNGFAKGSFAGYEDKQFPAELVHSYGLHIDTEPLLRKLRDKW